MFGPFECNMTTHVRYGEKNLLAALVAAERFQISGAAEKAEVAVTVVVTQGMIENLAHRDFDDSWPANRNGGIRSPVKLVLSDRIRIDDVFFQFDLEGASIDVTVDNPGPEPAQRAAL